MELLKLDISKRIPILNIKPPEIEEWELRLIIWECKNVKSYDSNDSNNSITGDLYVSCTIK